MPGPISSKILTALVVEDDTITQRLHRRLLDGLGIQNQVVVNGKEAVDLHRSGNNFDMILIDKDMPVMNGIEVYNYIYIYAHKYLHQLMEKNYANYNFFPFFNDDRQRESSAVWAFVV